MKRTRINTLLLEASKNRLSVKDLLKFYNNKERIQLIENSLFIMKGLLQNEIREADLKPYIFQRIVASAYNALESALILLFNKRDFHALHIVREVGEAECLLRYFLSFREEREAWWKLIKN